MCFKSRDKIHKVIIVVPFCWPSMIIATPIDRAHSMYNVYTFSSYAWISTENENWAYFNFQQKTWQLSLNKHHRVEAIDTLNWNCRQFAPSNWKIRRPESPVLFGFADWNMKPYGSSYPINVGSSSPYLPRSGAERESVVFWLIMDQWDLCNAPEFLLIHKFLPYTQSSLIDCTMCMRSSYVFYKALVLHCINFIEIECCNNGHYYYYHDIP